MCHTICGLLDAGPLQDWLANIKVWMDSNPSEVVTLLIVNSDTQDVSTFGSVFEASGIAGYGYAPTADKNGWPTLQAMIDAKTRLVTFIASVAASSAYPYLLSEFDHVFETAYAVTSLSGFNCTLDRPSSSSLQFSSALSAGLLPLMNHFAYSDLGASIMIPDVSDVATTNSASTSSTGALGLHAQTCLAQWGVKPTFVLVDFWSEGEVMETADAMNGVADLVGRRNATADDSATEANSANEDNDANKATTGRGAADMGTGALVAFFAAALLLL
jgi:hypothetical protein